jgi:CHAT domain-containing protein
MNETLKNENSIREYLLGRVSDETLLSDFGELLFLDDEFCSLAEITEDALINDFVFGRLSETDAADFNKTLENNRERREKVTLTKAIREKANLQIAAEKKTKPSFFESLTAFFQKPLNVGALAVLLVGILLLAFFVLRKPKTDELAELKTIYSKERPTETRISEFDYAPLVVTRGAAEDREKNKLRIIENTLRIAVEKNPSANSHHSLGVFLLTQRKFDEAIDELEKAVKLNENDAKIRNDLGSAYFEKAKTAPDEKKLETLANALENFSKAFELNPNLLAALFNKSLCLQELRLYNQAKEAWNLYLEKDQQSGWANEARKNLERLEQLKTTSKTKEQVLEDFLAAYRNRDEETAWKINSQTREMISGVWLPDQLSRRFLEAKIRGDDASADESIEALKFIGNLEKTRNADFFVAELAEYYSSVNGFQVNDLLKAKDLAGQGSKLILNRSNNEVFVYFRQARQLFEKTGNNRENEILDYWTAFNKRDLGQLKESLQDLSELLLKIKGSKFLAMRILTTQGEISFKMNKLTDAVRLLKKSLTISKESNDVLSLEKNASNLGAIYQTLGELKTAQNYLSKPILTHDLYYESSLQKMRNFWYLSNVLHDLNLSHCAAAFGEEALNLAKEKTGDASLAFDSTLDLAVYYLSLKNYEKAADLAAKNLELAQTFVEEEARNSALADSHLQFAHINRLNQNCEAAIINYDEAISRFEKKQEYQVDNFTAHKGRLICFEKSNRQTDFEKELETVLSLFEKYRTNILEEENRSAFFDREQSVANIASEYYLKQNDPRKAFDLVESSKARSLLDLVENKGVYDKQERQMVFNGSAKPFKIEEIQNRLTSNMQIVEYAVLENKIAVWIISNNRFETELIAVSKENLEPRIKAYLEAIKENSPQTREISKEIYNLLLKPVAEKLDKTKLICIVPDGILYYLSFASLVSTETDKYLIQDFNIFYSPSATTSILLSEKANNKPSGETILAVGNPEFDRKNNPGLSDLPSAETEVNKIAELYKNSTKLIGNQALKVDILKNLAHTNIFHFAGHYIANPNSPPDSKLLLTAPENSIDEFEGELRASEILQEKFPDLKLAILSACETGIERYYKGEGAIGMARIFLSAGAPQVVASQWQVDSDAAAALMIAFHENRVERKMNTVEALREAQLRMIASDEGKSPYYWAAFGVIGGKTNY